MRMLPHAHLRDDPACVCSSACLSAVAYCTRSHVPVTFRPLLLGAWCHESWSGCVSCCNDGNRNTRCAACGKGAALPFARHWHLRGLRKSRLLQFCLYKSCQAKYLTQGLSWAHISRGCVLVFVVHPAPCTLLVTLLARRCPPLAFSALRQCSSVQAPPWPLAQVHQAAHVQLSPLGSCAGVALHADGRARCCSPPWWLAPPLSTARAT